LLYLCLHRPDLGSLAKHTKQKHIFKNYIRVDMKHLKKILLVLLVTLTAIACKNDKDNPNTEKSGIEEPLKEENSIQKEQKLIFQKTLTLQNISFDIKTTGEGSVSQLSIQLKGLEIDNENIALQIDGQVVNAEIEDLNSDGFPEILIYTMSAGSGSYGNVIGYSVNNGKSISQIYFPELSDNKEASSGYMGHDEFAIIETTLARRFPVYKDGDTNNNPTGGMRQIEYKLKDGEASRLFVLDKISTY
jgi:hypothetical protein